MRRWHLAFAALVAGVLTATPAWAREAYDTPAVVLGPLLLLSVALMPLKVAVAQWAIGDAKLRFVFAILVETAACFLMLAPLAFMVTPLNLSNFFWLVILGGLVLFTLAYSIDFVILLFFSWGHRIEELARATAIANAVTISTVAALLLLLWYKLWPLYDFLVFIGRTISLALVDLTPRALGL